MFALTLCPEPTCGAPAEIVDHSVLQLTDGPTELVKTMCLHRHWFLLPASKLSLPLLPATTSRANPIPIVYEIRP